jgi:hypothetical protein
MNPNLAFQHMTPRRALAELAEVRLELVSAGERTIELVSRPNTRQAEVLKAFGVAISGWSKASESRRVCWRANHLHSEQTL